MPNVKRVPELSIEEDGWDGRYYYAEEPFTGLVFEYEKGVLNGEAWYQDGLRHGWHWTGNGPTQLLTVGHCLHNSSHGESWEYDETGRIRTWSVREHGLPVQLLNFSVEGVSTENTAALDSYRSAVLACRTRAGIEGEADPLIYPLRGPDYDTSLIIKEFFEPYR